MTFERDSTTPSCAFEKCLYPHACLGAANPAEYPDSKIHLEECNEAKGYSNTCTDEHGHKVRCRLCGTCIGEGLQQTSNERYKRFGGGARCKLCPPQEMNQFMLGVGFMCMCFGCAVMIYMEITSETSEDETSDAIKKIILNFVQLISLAGGLPLQWPTSVATMFDTFSTLSSAGTTLMIPDCELATMRTSDAFYLKQTMYTFAVPCLVGLVVCTWSVIVIVSVWWDRYGCCTIRALQFKTGQIKDYMVLSTVLLLFLAYPMMTKLCLSMLKCPTMGIGGADKRSFLMADLQEPCFEGRHATYVAMLTVPQLLLNVLGLPLVATLIILRNKERLHQKKFYTRYGLLYMGYQPGREWWELVVAMRKVAVVSIGTFGTLLGVVDLQAFIALAIVFVAILVHLIGQPFNVHNVNSKRLHNLEFAALTMSFFTFWGGLLFFLGNEKKGSVSEGVQVLTSVLLVASNSLFLCVSTFLFVRTYLFDRKQAKHRKHTKMLGNRSMARFQQVVPINNNPSVVPGVGSQGQHKDDEDDEVEEDFNHEISKRHRRQTSIHSTETVAEAHAIHDDFHESEKALHAKHRKKQQKQRRSTQLRVMARLKIRKTKALTKVPLFSNIPPERLAAAIESILELTTYQKAAKNDILCKQGDVANEFYIIVSGRCCVQVQGKEKATPPVEVGTLKELDFFGESALLGSVVPTKGNGQPNIKPTRNATVVVESDALQVLKLSCHDFQLLVEEGVLTKDVLSLVKEENAIRTERTRSSFAGALLPIPKPPTTMPPSMARKKNESGGSGVKKGGGDTGIDI